MPTTEGRLMPSISDDVRVLERVLADYEKAPRYGWPATNPACLRRVLDTMRALSGALRPFVGATLSEQGHVIGLMGEDFAKAAAALALYEGTK